MRIAHAPAGLFVAALVGVLAGCGTVAPSPGSSTPVGEAGPLDAEQILWADVLALYSQGLIHDLHREYDAALTNYLHAVELDPDNEPLTFRIAMGLLHRKQTDEAIRLMQQLQTRHPKSDQVRLWQAWIYRAADRNEDAADAYEALLALKSPDAASYLDAAAFFLSLDRREDAIRALEAGIDHADERFQLLVTLGRLRTDDARAVTDEKERRAAIKKALALYREAEELDPTDIDVLVKMGDLHILAGRPEKAIPLFSRAEAAEPTDLQLKQRLAASFLAIDDIDQAIAQLEEISRKQPSNAQVYYYLGELYQQQGDREQAITNFSLATKASDAPSGVIRLALLLIEDDPGEAVRVLQEGLEKRPDHPRYLSLLAYAQLRDDDTEGSLRSFARAETVLTEEGRTGGFYYNYGLACYRYGDLERAEEYLAAALDENLGLVEVMVQELADGSEEEVEQAIALVERLAARQDDEAAILLYLGILQSYAEKYEAAMATFARTEEVAATSPMGRLLMNSEFYFNYAAAAERMGQYERAEELFEKTLSIDPAHVHALNYMAYMWAEQNVKLEEAGERVTAALAIEPDNAAFLDTLGWIRYREGRYEEALEEIDRAATILPDDATIVDHLGDVYDKLGRDQEALIHWQRSFLLDPDNEKVRAKLEERGIDLAPLEAQAEERRRTLEGEEPAPPPDAPSAPEDDAAATPAE